MNKYQRMLSSGENPNETYRKVKYKIRSILKNECQIPIPFESNIDIKKATPFITKEVLEARSKRVWDFLLNRNVAIAVLILISVSCKPKKQCPAYSKTIMQNERKT